MPNRDWKYEQWVIDLGISGLIWDDKTTWDGPLGSLSSLFNREPVALEFEDSIFFHAVHSDGPLSAVQKSFASIGVDEFLRPFSSHLKRVQDQVIMQQNGNFTQVSFFIDTISDWSANLIDGFTSISLKSIFRSTNLSKWRKNQFQNIYRRNRRLLSNTIACQLLQIFLQQALLIWTRIELSNLSESKKESNWKKSQFLYQNKKFFTQSSGE